MAQQAQRPAVLAAPRAAAVITGNEIAAQNSPTPVTLPSLTDARAHLLAVVRQKPEPEPDLFDESRWRRNSRRENAARWLRTIPDTTNIATVIGVTPRCVNYWRNAEHAPTVRHWQQLRSLYAIVFRPHS